MLQQEIALYDFTVRLGDCHTLTYAEYGLLLCEVAATLQDELIGGASNFYRFAQRTHIADDLLEIQGGHGNNGAELHRRDFDGIDV